MQEDVEKGLNHKLNNMKLSFSSIKNIQTFSSVLSYICKCRSNTALDKNELSAILGNLVADYFWHPTVEKNQHLSL